MFAGKVEPLTIIDDRADWKASDWVGREEEYTYRFTKVLACTAMPYSEWSLVLKSKRGLVV